MLFNRLQATCFLQQECERSSAWLQSRPPNQTCNAGLSPEDIKQVRIFYPPLATDGGKEKLTTLKLNTETKVNVAPGEQANFQVCSITIARCCSPKIHSIACMLIEADVYTVRKQRMLALLCYIDEARTRKERNWLFCGP
jgi:hypothetical protein